MQSNRPRQRLPVEALWEYNVHEITLDGREILEKPLTSADNFQRVINAIDFDATDEDSVKTKDVASQKVGKVSEKIWLDLRDNIRNSLTEVCALVDLLAVMKETKCLAIFQVAPEEPDINYATFLAGKKMGLATAADTLLKGAERLNCRYSEISDARQASETTAKALSYHESLMQLRKSWRLKLLQNVVLGEVSLRSIGSRYKEGGNFEVFESDKLASRSNESEKSDEVTSVLFSSTMEALLKNGCCSGRLRVSLREVSETDKVEWQSLLNFYPHENIKLPSTKTPKNQLERLCLAQNIIACREILSTLSYEASVSKTGSRFNGTVAFSTQDEVIATVFPGVQLSVSLDKRSASTNSDHIATNTQILPGLSTQLRRLLHQQHISSWPNICSLPQIPTNAVQVPKRLRAAGAHCLPSDAFLTSTTRGSQCKQAFSSLPIVVASVSGFARPAASAWMAGQLSGGPCGRPMNHGAQDRHAFFNEWGTSVNLSATALPTAGVVNPTGSGTLDDVLASSSSLTAYEHALNMANMGESAKETVLGSSESLLGRLITLTRHYYLRQKVSRCLNDFAKSTNVCVVVHWHVNNSAVESSAFIIFYCKGYSNFHCRIGITVGTTGLTIYASDSPQTIRLGTDLTQLWSILQAQEIKSQMHALKQLTNQFLGWAQIGCVSSSASVDLLHPNDAPASVLLIGSPKANHIACIRGSIGSGIRLLIKKTSSDVLSQFMTDSKQLQAVIENIEEVAGGTGGNPNTGGDTPATRPSTPVVQERGGGGFKEVDLAAVPGFHAVEKIEAILTCLS